jgi:SAM-dependent methyltransferase
MMNFSPLPDKATENSQARVEQTWLESAAGIYLLEKEQALFDTALFDLFGFNAVQMGFEKVNLLRNSRVPHRLIASSQVGTNGHLYCTDDFLPFAEMSLDVLLLPHRLEFSARAHQTLREAARVLMPEGHLLITGFNPWSAWGVKALTKKIWHKLNNSKAKPAQTLVDYPWNAQMIRLSRLKDWLALLGLEVVLVEMTCHAPPFHQEHWLRKCGWLDILGVQYLRRLGLDRFGGVYFLVAKKRVTSMTPLKPKWKSAPLGQALVRKPKPNQQKNPTQKKNNETN